jgi:hypothetical protein
MLHTNNTVNKYRVKAGLKPIYLDSDNVLDERERAEAIDAYKDHFVNTQIAREQVVLKEDNSIYIYAKEGQAAANEAKPKKEPKKTDAQRLKESVFETPPSERAKSGVGQGTIVSGPNKKYKIASKDDGGKVGYWYEIDKDGFIIGNPVPEATVKKQVGYKKQ